MLLFLNPHLVVRYINQVIFYLLYIWNFIPVLIFVLYFIWRLINAVLSLIGRNCMDLVRSSILGLQYVAHASMY